MAQVTKTLPQTAVTLAIEAGKAQHKATGAMFGKYDAMADVAAEGGKVANADLHNALRLQFVYGYCVDAGIKVAISDKGAIILANPDSASLADADAFADCKRDARSVFGMGMSRAYTRKGITAPPSQKPGGGRPAATPATTTPATTTPGDVTGIPPTILHDMESLNLALVQFQSTAKLTAKDKAEFGKVCDMARKLYDDMQGKATPAAPAGK